jgi:hypothetical protein
MSNRVPFNENIVSPKRDPLAPDLHRDFDWNGLYESLGENEEERSTNSNQLIQGLKRIVEWVLDTRLTDRHAEMVIARRFIALAWVINPDYLEGKSLTQIARVLRIRHKQSLSKYAANAKRRFNISNRAQAHGWNFKPAPEKNLKAA